MWTPYRHRMSMGREFGAHQRSGRRIQAVGAVPEVKTITITKTITRHGRMDFDHVARHQRDVRFACCLFPGAAA